MLFHRSILQLDAEAETHRLCSFITRTVRGKLRRQGVVVGISGGIDSSVVLALCARSFPASRILPVLLPEQDSDPQSEAIARRLAAHFGVDPILEVITPALDGFACYQRRDEAVRRVFPDYDPAAGDRIKVTLPNALLDEGTLNVFSLTVLRDGAPARSAPLAPSEFRQITSASNFKQRSRMCMLNYHAERLNYAVVGTANRNEHDQGFFVKHGDAGVDLQPIAHLFKTQVYQLAAALGVPDEIQRRTPTSDTYSAPSTQEEFFFRLPFETLDLLWWALDHNVPAADAASVMGLTPLQVERAYLDIGAKHRNTEPLRLAPLMLDPIEATAQATA